MDDPMFRTASNLTVLALLICGLSGCKMLEGTKATPQAIQKSVQNLMGKKEKSEFEEPIRMAAIWSDGIYDQVGSPRIRGFGARLFFYNQKGEPIKVDGELTVFGYDDSVAKEDYSPDRKFIFERSNFQSHYSQSELGNSYSIWVPWEKAGTGRKSVSLIPIFKTANGTVVKGGQTVNVLPGPEPKPLEENDDSSSRSSNANAATQKPNVKNADETAVSTKSGVRTAAYEEPSKSESTGDAQTQRLNSNAVTIELPRSLSRRLNSLPPQRLFERKTKNTSRGSDSSNTPINARKQPAHSSDQPPAHSSDQPPIKSSFKKSSPPVFGKPGS